MLNIAFIAGRYDPQLSIGWYISGIVGILIVIGVILLKQYINIESFYSSKIKSIIIKKTIDTAEHNVQYFYLEGENGVINIEGNYPSLWESVEVGDRICKSKNSFVVRKFRSNILIDSFLRK